MATIGVIASAAGGVDQLCDELVMPLVDVGHQVSVTLTPTAFTWLTANGEAARIEAATGFEVRGASRLPWEPRTHPASLDVIVVAPATFNTTAKIALGLADNQALTVVTENLATTPVVLFPLINAAHAQHPAWPSHMAALRSAGVHLIEGPTSGPSTRRARPHRTKLCRGKRSSTPLFERRAENEKNPADLASSLAGGVLNGGRYWV